MSRVRMPLREDTVQAAHGLTGIALLAPRNNIRFVDCAYSQQPLLLGVDALVSDGEKGVITDQVCRARAWIAFMRLAGCLANDVGRLRTMGGKKSQRDEDGQAACDLVHRVFSWKWRLRRRIASRVGFALSCHFAKGERAVAHI
jgi:hypothetical protein